MSIPCDNPKSESKKSMKSLDIQCKGFQIEEFETQEILSPEEYKSDIIDEEEEEDCDEILNTLDVYQDSEEIHCQKNTMKQS